MSVLTARATARVSLRYQRDTGLGRLTPAERVERGKAARAAVLARAHTCSGDRIAIAAYLRARTSSTRPTPGSQPPTPTRTSTTTKPSSTPSRQGGSPPNPTCKTPAAALTG
jgi:hypothetical protein